MGMEVEDVHIIIGPGVVRESFNKKDPTARVDRETILELPPA